MEIMNIPLAEAQAMNTREKIPKELGLNPVSVKLLEQPVPKLGNLHPGLLPQRINEEIMLLVLRTAPLS